MFEWILACQGTGKKVGNVTPQHRSFKESRIFFFLLVSQNESATDFQRRVWCLKTKCNVSGQLGPFHWSTSQLQYLLPLCWQKVSFVLFFAVLYASNDISILFTSGRARIYSSLSWLYRETSFNWGTCLFPIFKIDLFGRRGGGYCSIHQREVCMFKLGILTSFNMYLDDQFHVKFITQKCWICI